MRKKNIKISALLICCVLFFNCFSWAVETVSDSDEKTVMTMEEAIQYALEHNPSVVDINKKVKDQEEAFRDAKDLRQSWRNKLKSGGYSFETQYDYLACFGYLYEMSELAYNSFISGKGATEKVIAYTVKQLSYSIDELEKTIECLEKTVKKQENDVKIAEVKSRLNMVTPMDVTTANITLNSTKLQLESLRTTLNSVKVNLKNIMGYDIAKELEITLPDTEMTILNVEDLAKVIEDSLNTNSDALAAKIEYKQKEMDNLIATKTYFFETRDEVKNAKRDYVDAEARLSNSLNYIKENLYALYNKVKSSEESVIIAKGEYEKMQTQYTQMKVMHELGMITTHDFNSYEIALINSKNTYESKLHENILLNERWNIAITVGDVLAKEA